VKKSWGSERYNDHPASLSKAAPDASVLTTTVATNVARCPIFIRPSPESD
jgi:hypothetical protein